MVMIKLYDYQTKAIDLLKSGSILCGGVGSGKSLTAVGYFNKNYNKQDLYIITTAKKRDSLEWDKECSHFAISKKRDCSINGIQLVVDSWNSIKKYKNITNDFFIFDEQRLIGSGSWVKAFLKIAKNNKWILLSATPGDTWSDYIPVFLANGFYKNRTEFLRTHAVYNRFTKYPQIERYIEEKTLIKYRDLLLVTMDYKRVINKNNYNILTNYDKVLYDKVLDKRWNIFKDEPIKTISETCFLLRKIVNNDPSRIIELKKIFNKHKRLIVFYNFNYELDTLLEFGMKNNINTKQWNGHKHEEVPDTKEWLYLVQYTSGAEGWNCIKTNTIVFYSQNYSYKIMIQAAGRIDRLNSSFAELYYYHLRSKSSIDNSISRAILQKKNFNELSFASQDKHML